MNRHKKNLGCLSSEDDAPLNMSYGEFTKTGYNLLSSGKKDYITLSNIIGYILQHIFICRQRRVVFCRRSDG